VFAGNGLNVALVAVPVETQLVLHALLFVVSMQYS